MVLSTEWSQVEVIDLVNDGNGLGFILVGGRSTGVVIKALTPGGVAERDGRLQCGDHLLQIGDVNLRGFSSEQVATVLRQSGAQVRLIVARSVESGANDLQMLASHAPIIPTKLLSDPEELSRHLFHNPSFATSTSSGALNADAGCSGTISIAVPVGVVIDVDVDIRADANAEAEAATAAGMGGDGSAMLTTPDTEMADLPLPPIPTDSHSVAATRNCPRDLDIVPFSIVSPPGRANGALSLATNTASATTMDHIETVIAGMVAGTPTTPLDIAPSDDDRCSTASSNYLDSPETETYEVQLRKNVYGLGITVAGYVCEEEELSGIFVKSIIEGSAAEMSGRIQINDRIVAVDGRTLAGVTNHQAVDILRNTDIEVHLTLERFLRGRKYEHLQVALTELKGSTDTQSQYSLPASPSIATLSWLPPKSDADSIANDGDLLIMEFADLPSRDTVESNMSHMLDRSVHSCHSGQSGHTTPGKPLPESMLGTPVQTLTPTLTPTQTTPTTIPPEREPTAAQKTLANGRVARINGHAHGEDADECNESVVRCSDEKTPTPTSMLAPTAATVQVTTTITATTTVASQRSFTITAPGGESLKVAWKSLGISLEGTVDVECGVEKRPHHYIRSILEDGPVGRQGILKPGDELLQVNEHKLQGLRHTEVVKILKELPTNVKLVCARGPKAPSIINTSKNPEAFESRSILPGGHQSLQNMQHLMTKALSESSLYTSSTATLTDQQRSKSLENVSGLALWSTDVTEVQIEKTEQGFGFSILDYQDPLDPEGSVIVIRGLIRGGSAEATNEIFPGDRLVSVGEHSLHGVELDEAVAILKGMPLGVTTLGICRPLSTSDSNIASPTGDDSPST